MEVEYKELWFIKQENKLNLILLPFSLNKMNGKVPHLVSNIGEEERSDFKYTTKHVRKFLQEARESGDSQYLCESSEVTGQIKDTYSMKDIQLLRSERLKIFNCQFGLDLLFQGQPKLDDMYIIIVEYNITYFTPPPS